MEKYKSFTLSLLLLVFWVTNLFAFDPESGERRGNPFSLPEGVVSRSKLSKKDDKEKLVLQAITAATGGEKRIASISGENFLVGDEVNGRKIIIIGSDFVILERGPEKMKLTLERRPFSVQVREETGKP